MALADRTPPTTDEFVAYKQRFSNWGRWGADDQLGTLNHITEDVRRSAGTLIREGRTISCANPIAKAPGPRNPTPAQHFMTVGPANSSDYIGVSYHGYVTTHIDALCHIFTGAGGQLYNGRPSSLVTSFGAESNSVDYWRDSIVTRGVLYDIPRLRDTPHVTVDEPVHGWELLEAAEAQGVEPRPGDAVLVRSGLDAFFEAHPESQPLGSPTPGVHASALEFLHEYDSALLGWDLQEAANQGYPGSIVGLDGRTFSSPIHEVGIAYMGLPVIDNVNLERLSDTCAELGRYEFMFVASPLIIPGGTGSPLNPVAVF
jgi:kynurenine formamidase